MNAVATQRGRPNTRILKGLVGSPLRGGYEQLIRSRYALAHGAELVEFMPNLLGCIGEDDQPLAVLGYRSAAAGPCSSSSISIRRSSRCYVAEVMRLVLPQD